MRTCSAFAGRKGSGTKPERKKWGKNEKEPSRVQNYVVICLLICMCICMCMYMCMCMCMCMCLCMYMYCICVCVCVCVRVHVYVYVSCTYMVQLYCVWVINGIGMHMRMRILCKVYNKIVDAFVTRFCFYPPPLVCLFVCLIVYLFCLFVCFVLIVCLFVCLFVFVCFMYCLLCLMLFLYLN